MDELMYLDATKSPGGGGSVLKKLRIYMRTTTILYGGITFNFLFFPHPIIM